MFGSALQLEHTCNFCCCIFLVVVCLFSVIRRFLNSQLHFAVFASRMQLMLSLDLKMKLETLPIQDERGKEN